jgi:hypothetical protein
MKRILMLAGLVTVFTYCGPSGSFDNGRQNNSNAGGTATNTKANTSRGTNTGTGTLPGPDDGGQTPAGESFFNLTVKPALTRCIVCHANNGIPLDYSTSKAKLNSGANATAKNNALINKAALINGVTSHGGLSTKYCNNIDADSPCKEFQDWWGKENPSGGGTGTNTGGNTGQNTGTGTGTGALRGEAFFNANVKSKFDTSCKGCHGSFDYVRLRGYLKSGGTTADNNTLINKAAGNNHPGGTICSAKSSSPCLEFQNWFNNDP